MMIFKKLGQARVIQLSLILDMQKNNRRKF
jgi:hypothetical protein